MSGFSSPEQLLKQTGWMKSLARGLVGEDARAEDLVQEAMLVAVARPPRNSPVSGSWLARVLRNLAFRSHREEYRRRRREQVAARPDVVSTTPADLLERAELHRQVVGAVIGLDEPYRSTVLLRFFEELKPKEIARRQGVPVATVWTRLKRAIERLRGSLDREYGGNRRAWQVAFLPLLGYRVVATSASAGAATTGTTASGATSGTSAGAATTGASAGGAVAGGSAGTLAAAGSAASASLPWLTIGGIVMTQKLAVAGGIIGAISLVLGICVGHVIAPTGPSKETIAKMYVGRQEYDDLKAENKKLTAELDKVSGESQKVSRRNEELEAEVASLTKKLEAEEKPPEAKTEVAQAKGLPVSFGKWSDLEEVKNADWEEMAKAVQAMTAMILDIVERDRQGLSIGAELQEKIQAENNKLVKYAAAVMGKIPTHSPINGEFTHPITLVNLMGAVLEHANVPLTQEQIRDIQAFGNGYDEDYDHLQGNYTEGTAKFQKFIDELELKRDYMNAVQELLTPEQRQLVAHPDIHNRLQLDLLSPALSTILLAQPSDVASGEEIRNKICSVVSNEYGLNPNESEPVRGIVDQWCQELEPILEKPVDGKAPLHLDRVIAAGRAQANAFREFLSLPDLSEKARGNLMMMQALHVPRLVKKSD